MSGYDAGYFDREYFRLHPGKRRFLDAWLGRLRDLSPPEGPLLDLGAGLGFWLDAVRASGRVALGLEGALAAVAARGGGGAPIAVASVEAPLPFADERFAAVTMFDVIEHLERFELALREARRVLRPGGWLVVSTSNAASVARPLLGARWNWRRDPTHRQLFGRASLARALVEAGFDRPRVSTYFNFCSVGESTPFLRPLSRIGRLVDVPWFGDALLGLARR